MHIRRLRGFVAVTFATVLALSACATENDNGTSSTEQPSTSTPSSASPTGELLPAAEGTTTYPYVISTQWGETTLEERPERIAVLGFSSNSDVLQALDVIPVYAMTEDGDFEWKSQEWLDAVEFTDTATRRDPINFEGVAGTNPDLIVIHNWLGDQADYDRLATIAPVLDHAVSDRDALDWRADQRLIGEALDLSAAAEKVIADADARVAEIAAAHPEFEGKTVTIATEYDAGLSYYTFPGGPAEAALLDLGFVPNPLAQSSKSSPATSRTTGRSPRRTSRSSTPTTSSCCSTVRRTRPTSRIPRCSRPSRPLPTAVTSA